MKYDLHYKLYGNQAVLIEWPQDISDIILKDIINFKAKIKGKYGNNIEDLISGYSSLTIKYFEAIKDFREEVEVLKKIYSKSNIEINKRPFTWQIPVCYDQTFGIDLKFLSEAKNRSIEDIINIHSKVIYTVYFIGFLPGFLYLGGLDSALYTSRKAIPRLSVTKGAVAIGGKQTGIYPNDSAGGWQIIGKTPICFFDVNKKEPCFATAGDKIQFIPIAKTEYFELEKAIKNKLFQLKPTNR